MIEDNPDDVFLMQEALKETTVHANLKVLANGAEGLAFLRQKKAYRPHLILLDWNLPKKCGAEVLAEIKGDPELKSIPVIVLSTSEAEQDILRAYSLHANCYITKPINLDYFFHIISSIEDFWLTIARLPGRH